TLPPQQTPADRSWSDGLYVVVTADEPIATYTGGVKGLSATAGKAGDARPSAVRAYAQHLTSQQDAVLSRVDAPRPVERYTHALSGVAVELTAEQARKLSADPRVLSVTENRLETLHTDQSPEMLGLTGPDGVWKHAGDTQGQGVVVGVIDSGINPANPSFDDAGMTAPPADWRGACKSETPADFPESTCDNKIIGAKVFREGLGEHKLADHESHSPLDVHGHGSHTASTATGAAGTKVSVNGLPSGPISGMAPKAHVAAYKACWELAEGRGVCPTVDTTAAIDAAVADGVDIINYSISGTDRDLRDPVEVAFMNAAASGVFVAASSGNDGPKEATTNHPSPWVTTVAAGAHAEHRKTLVTGDGQRYEGSSMTPPLPQEAPLVLADEVAPENASPSTECRAGTLDPAKVKGTIVVCDRSEANPMDQSRAVKDAGGVGMVLVNTEPGDTLTHDHWVPTVHLDSSARKGLRAYARGSEATASLVDEHGDSSTVPSLADFSSRGPTNAAQGNLLKPDLTAPGVDVLAAWSSAERGRPVARHVSGTSMSAPHVAGLAALVKQAHPDWSPMAIKSAMMTTSRKMTGPDDNHPFGGGAGFVEPRAFLDPGLVVDSDASDWERLLAGQGARMGQDVDPIKPWQLNTPSIAVGGLLGEQTVTRTVTNTTGRTTTWTPKVSGLDGVETSVSPQRLTLAPGESGTVTLTFTDTGMPAQQWVTGRLDLTASGVNPFHLPIALRSEAVQMPSHVLGHAGQSTVPVELRSSRKRDVALRTHGMVPGREWRGTVRQDKGEEWTGREKEAYRVPFEAKIGDVFWAEIESDDPNVNLDLTITWKEFPGYPLDRGRTPAANERLIVPSIGTDADFELHVTGTDLKGKESTDFTLRLFVLSPDAADAGNLAFKSPVHLPRIAPHTAEGAVSVDDPTKAWLGMVEMEPAEGGEPLARTLVHLDPSKAEKVSRVGGANRYATAARLARSMKGDHDTVYVASGQDHPDALAGASVASSKNAPLLLTRRDRLPAETREALAQIGPRKVVILGGEKAVSREVAGQLAAGGRTVERVAGANRYATAARLTAGHDAPVDTVYLASGQDYPDALTGAAVAGAQDAPLLLTRGDRLPTETRKALQRMRPDRVVILGGRQVVKGSVFAEAGEYADAVRRIGGADRYETAELVARSVKKDPYQVFVASGENYPDALTAAAVAGTQDTAVLLTRSDRLPEPTSRAVTRLSPWVSTVVGGATAVGDKVVQALRGITRR
ncbi:cell wall-binding repeat-containing protein, partial [Kytococcus schroeteri]|uniref:cell wall-binding repeat-containing protein n=1 Tax=Kytococcus schroeteri TaxID=138300 RepID=UPI001144986F